MIEFEIEQDNTIDVETQNDETIEIKTTVDSIEFKNITGNVEDNSKLVNYIDSHGGKIDKIKVNGTEQPIENKAVDLSIPTKTSDLVNDSNFVNQTELATKQDVITANTELDIKKVNFGDGTYVDKATLQQTSSAIQNLNENKVDKETGKGLSTNDYSNEEKQKLDDVVSDVDDIKELIPNDASSTNQLADKNYVDTHIPTIPSFQLEFDWTTGSKSLVDIKGTIQDI